MPFIACLNNVKTTHARKHMPFPRRPFTRNETNQRTPDPPHNQGMSRQTLHTPQTHKDTGPRREDNYTLTTHHPPGITPTRLRAVKMLASTMQISNNNPTNPPAPTTDGNQSKGRNQNHQPPHTTHVPCRRPDASGPNSVLDPTPTNVGHE